MRKVMLIALLLSICSGAMVAAHKNPTSRTLKRSVPVIVVISENPALVAMVVKKLAGPPAGIPPGPPTTLPGGGPAECEGSSEEQLDPCFGGGGTVRCVNGVWKWRCPGGN